MLDRAHDLKAALKRAGFRIYRSGTREVILAERVRDDLLSDSGVSASCDPHLAVRFTVIAAHSSFPQDDERGLFARARALGTAGKRRGYDEVATRVVRVPHPNDGQTTLDTRYEVAFEKRVSSADQMQDELRFALGIRRSAD